MDYDATSCKIAQASGPAWFTHSTSASRHQECALCLERFKSPRILPCFHTFCLDCLSKLIKTRSYWGSFPCPTCRTKVKIPPGGAEEFQVNFYIESDSATARHSPDNAPVCSVCGDDEPATHECRDCSQLLCDWCARGHPSAAACSCRDVIRLQAPPHETRTSQPLREERHCAWHPQEKYRFFCQLCRVPLCRDCKLTSHEGHATCDLRRVASLASTLAFDVQRDVCDLLLPRLTETLEQARQHREALPQRKGELLAALTRRAEVMKEAVDACLYEAVLALVTQASRAEEAVEQALGDMEHQVACCQSLSDHVTRTVASGADVDMLQMTSELASFFGPAKGQAARHATSVTARLKPFTDDCWRMSVHWSESDQSPPPMGSETRPKRLKGLAVSAELAEALSTAFGTIHTDAVPLQDDAGQEMEDMPSMMSASFNSKRSRYKFAPSSSIEHIVTGIQNRIAVWMKHTQ